MKLEVSDINLKVGDQLKIKGEIPHDAERFQIDLGLDAEDLALHFNPRFHDDTAVVVCNSKTAGCWGEERRETQHPLQRGMQVKMVLKMTGQMFEVELPHGHHIYFPNREDLEVMKYLSITGDFKVTCLKMCM
ncbi:galectin-1-like [Entelurus aequoreus]|uniref:galectin-1-like n=1 Tax=Entelurus aequoreus TaxID=161455 RepID=UPI002B1D6891|nr:galectin-1-like [Entelurus aequoreus]XP_061892275.1 galectin-1-like [Entelurus aequoreus]XP_061894136.1 galectin-1-like [Entelurus aequoreus]XP_061894137.1 galectin-1-like [Entelurus aequoreus]